ncbi:MAG: SpoVG family protein [Bdellovibrionaceae bacterium]|nr:SpoVG family protein [Pseudobdellovibrionaceae bacterium]
MKITDVKINLVSHQEPLKAFVSITFDACFVVHDLRVIKTQGKTFIAMPSKKIKDVNRQIDIYKDIAHPINSEMRDLIEKTVLEKYKSTVEDIV